ncbi:MAG: beta-eliminating lyase-related protein [Candidatus Eremiobacteraeota bacterium]|nr:beta-eliminating lyase-related protein [Candidatus Eremiobacteraeota bacterium]
MKRESLRTFASDNNAPVAPEIMEALVAANAGDAVAYGDDPVTERAAQCFREQFGPQADVFFAFNGTGANVVALSCLLRPFEAVIAPASAHLQTDECGAFERFSGSKILAVPSADGKLHPPDIQALVAPEPDQHHVVPRGVSISNTTEFGGIYTLEEIRVLCRTAHEREMFVHVDGARICNAAVALGVSLRECTVDLGVDVLTFGGTKNGLMGGEAIVFFDSPAHAGMAPFVRKQAMQLASKMRFVAAQFEALFVEDRWHRYASHANAMAKRLEARIADIPSVRITRPVQANAVFATLDRAAMDVIAKRYFFHVFDERLPEARWMTHFATREKDVDAFADAVREAVS